MEGIRRPNRDDSPDRADDDDAASELASAPLVCPLLVDISDNDTRTHILPSISLDGPSEVDRSSHKAVSFLRLDVSSVGQRM